MKWNVSEELGRTFKKYQEALIEARETRRKTIGSEGERLGELYRMRDRAFRKLRKESWSRLSQ